MSKPILIGLSPNTDKTDVWLAFKLLLQPWRWEKGEALNRLSQRLTGYFKIPYCCLLNSARSALYLGLKSLNLKSTDEVLYQGFTCTVVPQAIVKAGAKAVAVGHNRNDFNLSVKDLARKITSRARAVIIQHTFGQADDLAAIVKICRQNRLVLIEDCAHALGAEYQGKPIGSFGDLTVLSFGRDKVISSVFGGALLSHQPLTLPDLNYPDKLWIGKQLLHPLIFSVAVPFYFSFGKLLVFLARELKLITLPLTNLPIKLLPNALAELAWRQWQKLDRINQHRQKIAQIYAEAFHQPFDPEAIYLRFPLSVKDSVGLIKFAKTRHIWLGDWYDNQIVNLPTHIRMNLKDAARVIKIVKAYVNH